MSVLGDLLFYRRDQVGLDDVLRHQVEQLRGKVDALPEMLFAEKSDEEIAAHIAGQEAVKPLTVDFAAATPSVCETQVEVHDRFGFERGPVRVAGLQATKSIPFTGDPDLWFLRTNPWSLNPPRGDVRGNKLVIGITVPAQQADEAARYIDETIDQIPQYLERQSAQIAQHNASIASHAMQWVKLRRQRLGTASDLLKKLGG
ncbi:hypothetical protein HTY52_23275 [Cupriavidus taiwanensis]|uniref:hypothetical protein n=1 Tax=Cupriavidus taiwanensis TaxID=164546 RepID=UPI001571CC0E|nr:hypothetical protein [Cupriavidus taiwanensis]NSX17018.1 hypothetical protein [Cupriavidus taiwanensis]